MEPKSMISLLTLNLYRKYTYLNFKYYAVFFFTDWNNRGAGC